MDKSGLTRVENFIKQSNSSEITFNELFCDLYQEQLKHNPVMKKYYDSFISDVYIAEYRHLPPIPVQFFKEFEMRSYETHDRERCWHSSGTSGKISKTFLSNTEIYDLVIRKLWKSRVPQFGRLIGRTPTTYRLIPTEKSWPNSSLAHFFDLGQKIEAPDFSSVWVTPYQLQDDSGRFEVDYDQLINMFESHEDYGIPARLVGTSYAIASVFDKLQELNARFKLPEGSSVLDTGGYKGLVRDRSREEFLDQAFDTLNLDPAHCVNEYGMSELSSHFWNLYLDGEEWWYVPPWVRVRSADPLTNEDSPEGVAVFYDLANVWSCCAVQTQDRVELMQRGNRQYIRPLGRVKDAELKGCSITAEQAMR